MNNILLAIPCYCCEKQIQRVLDKLSSEVIDQVSEVLLVDNCSPDKTTQVILQNLKLRNNQKFSLIQNKSNFGLGGSFKIVVNYAHNKQYDYVVWFHGDDQGCSLEILDLIEEIKKNSNISAVFGARFMPSSSLVGYSKVREVSNRLLNRLFSFATQKKICEIGSGLNIYKLSDLPIKLLKTFPDHIAFDVPLLLYYVRKKLNFVFFPITWKELDQKSNAPNIKVTQLILKELFLWTLNISQKRSNSFGTYKKLY